MKPSEYEQEIGDHPRGCGENQQLLHGLLIRLGSPPRMRGKPHTDAAAIRPTGITPADAGKTILG